MSGIKFPDSLKEGPHQKLNLLAGRWSGQTKTWFAPGDPVDDSPMTGTIRPLFDGKFMIHEYKGSFQGKPFEGIAIYGYNLNSAKFESAWIDSFHTGTAIMFSQGAPNGVFYNALSSYDAGTEPPQTWGWRTEIEIKNPDEIVLTAYNISPEGEESKGTETIYFREKSLAGE